MKKNIPMISLTLGLLFALVLHQFSPLNSEFSQPLPLLGSLFMAEIGMLGGIYASYVSYSSLKQDGRNLLVIALLLGNVILAINFAQMGMQLWQILQPH